MTLSLSVSELSACNGSGMRWKMFELQVYYTNATDAIIRNTSSMSPFSIAAPASRDLSKGDAFI